MTGYLKRNNNGVKEIREGDVVPEWELNYAERHTMGNYGWTRYWEDKIAWDKAKVIPVHPGLYWAFPEEEGKIEYAMYGGYAIPTNIAPAVTEPTQKTPPPTTLNTPPPPQTTNTERGEARSPEQRSGAGELEQGPARQRGQGGGAGEMLK